MVFERWFTEAARGQELERRDVERPGEVLGVLAPPYVARRPGRSLAGLGAGRGLDAQRRRAPRRRSCGVGGARRGLCTARFRERRGSRGSATRPRLRAATGLGRADRSASADRARRSRPSGGPRGPRRAPQPRPRPAVRRGGGGWRSRAGWPPWRKPSPAVRAHRTPCADLHQNPVLARALRNAISLGADDRLLRSAIAGGLRRGATLVRWPRADRSAEPLCVVSALDAPALIEDVLRAAQDDPQLIAVPAPTAAADARPICSTRHASSIVNLAAAADFDRGANGPPSIALVFVAARFDQARKIVTGGFARSPGRRAAFPYDSQGGPRLRASAAVPSLEHGGVAGPLLLTGAAGGRVSGSAAFRPGSAPWRRRRGRRCRPQTARRRRSCDGESARTRRPREASASALRESAPRPARLPANLIGELRSSPTRP